MTVSPSSLTSLVSAIIAPVALITPTAILLGNYTAKYTAIAGQMRQLSAEHRQADTAEARRKSVRSQLRLFHRRIAAMWAASGALLMALLSFLVTVLSLLFVHRTPHVFVVGASSIVAGLVFILIAVLLELYEIGLARLTIAGNSPTCSRWSRHPLVLLLLFTQHVPLPSSKEGVPCLRKRAGG